MTITADGIAKVVDFLAGEFDKIEVLDAGEVESEEKTPIVEALTGRVRSTVLFDHTEANFTIGLVRLYSGATLIAEEEVEIVKTDRQSLTLVRRDFVKDGGTE